MSHRCSAGQIQDSMEVSDDEVVMKGSELDKYLEAQGLSDYEIAENTVPSDSSMQVPEAVKQKHWTIFKYFRTAPSKEPRCLLKEIKLILKSGLLFPEDCQMVENLIPALDESKEENCTWLKSFTVHSTTLGGSLLMWYKHIVPFIVPTVVSCCSGCIWFLRFLDMHHALQREKIIQEMLISQLHFSLLRKKTIKMLKELEMFGRGLTLSILGHSKINEDSNLLLNAKQWCAVPQLREALASCCLDVIKLLMEATKQMVLSFPIGLSCDSHSNYIAFLSWKEMGIDDSLNNKRSSEWTITDLQKLHDTSLLIQSEFLRRLCLCFSEDLCPVSFTRMSEILCACEDLNKKVLSVTDILTKEYRTYKHYKGKEKCKKLENLRGKTWQFSDIYESTHHVTLHLQCLLRESEKLEELLQDIHSERKSGISTERYLQELQKSASFIDKHLDLCKNSVNDILIRIKNLLNKSAVISDLKNSLTEDKPSELQVQNIIPILVGHSEWDPPGEDEVFEEVISYQPDSSCCGTGLNADDITAMKNRTLFSRNVLLELKGALVVKREEWKAREEKALRKKLLRDGKITNLEADSDEHVLPDKLHSCEERNVGEVATLGLSSEDMDEKSEFERKFYLSIDSKETLPKFNEAMASSCSETCTSNPFETASDAEKPVKTFLAEAPKAIPASFLTEDLFSADGETSSDDET